MGEAILSDSEAAVMTNFDFLQQADVEISDDDDMSDDLNLVVGGVDETSMKTTKRKVKGELSVVVLRSLLNSHFLEHFSD
jgi:hypothetical protein